MISFSQSVEMALIYTSIKLTCRTLIIKMKNSICASLIVIHIAATTAVMKLLKF